MTDIKMLPGDILLERREKERNALCGRQSGPSNFLASSWLEALSYSFFSRSHGNFSF
jgi:hypothetical protein